MNTKNLIVLIYFIIGFIYWFYYWYKYYDSDYKTLKLKGEVEDGMVCNLMMLIIAFWPMCFIIDIWRMCENIGNKFNKILNK